VIDVINLPGFLRPHRPRGASQQNPSAAATLRPMCARRCRTWGLVVEVDRLAEFAAMTKAEHARWSAVLDGAGLLPN
jgi:hypothetical protein